MALYFIIFYFISFHFYLEVRNKLPLEFHSLTWVFFICLVFFKWVKSHGRKDRIVSAGFMLFSTVLFLLLRMFQAFYYY